MQEEEIVAVLESMEADGSMLTAAAYRANTEKWPTNSISFVETHISYLKTHPAVNPSYYLSNLKLMLRIKA